ncbi:unnamed protein product [Closterium sp. NIES-54]
MDLSVSWSLSQMDSVRGPSSWDPALPHMASAWPSFFFADPPPLPRLTIPFSAIFPWLSSLHCRTLPSCVALRPTILTVGPRSDKLSARAIPCVFLGFVPDAPGWQFYHPASRCVLPSQDVTFDESVPFYRLFPYHSAPSPPPSRFFLLPVRLRYTPSRPRVAVVSGAAPGAASGGAASGGAEPGGAGSEGAGSRGAEPEGVEPGGTESEGAESGGAEPQGAALSGGPAGASPRLSSQQLREWLVQRAHHRSGAPGAGGPGGVGAGGAAVTTGVGDPTEPRTAGAGGAGAGVAGVGGPGAAGAGAAGAGVVEPGAGGAGGTVWPRPYFVPLLVDRQEDFECLAAAVPHFASLLLPPEGDPDAPDIPPPRSYAEVITGPYSSQWQAAMDAEMASWKSTGTYVDEVPPPGVNIVDGMWIFRVKLPPGSPPALKACYVA